MEESFAIRLRDNIYRIIPYCERDSITYEVLTAREKLFTLQMSASGSWQTIEANVIPIDKELVVEIGDAIMMHYTS